MQRSIQKTWLIRLLTLAAIGTLAAAPALASPEAGGPDQLDTKLNAYVECYNSLDGSAHSTIQRYASWVKDMKAGPTGRERIVYGLYQINARDVTSCKDKFAKAQDSAPVLPLDGAGAGYMKAIDGLHQVVEEMYPYYDRENYKDDKFAKGKELHVRFVYQVALFKTASKHFSEELETENGKRLEAQLERLEKEDGRKLPYLKMAMMHKAKALVHLLQQENAPADQIAVRVDAFEKAADEGIRFAKDNPQGLPMMLSMFEHNIEDFRKAAKERMRRLRDKTPYDTGETMLLRSGTGWMVNGTEEKAIRAYNAMVNSGNGLR